MAVSGVGGTAVFNSVTYNVLRWSFEVKSKREETTHAGSGGYKNSLQIYKWGEGKIELQKVTRQALPVIGQSGTFTMTGGAEAKTITGTGEITNIGVTCETHGVISCVYDFETTDSSMVQTMA